MLRALKNSLLALLLLGLVAIPITAQTNEDARPPFIKPVADHLDLDPARDVVLVKAGPDVLVQQMQGLEALEHLQNLRSQNPEAFAKARRSLLDKGFKPTNHVFVERTVRVASRPGDTNGVAFAQDYSESNAEGEILFWSWSDGDDTTWEGEIYVEVYSTNDASAWEGQIDASNEDHEWIYYEKTWEKPTEEFRDTSSNPEAPQQLDVLPAVISPQTERFSAQYRSAGWIAWAGCWRENVVAGCAGAAVGCIATNGGWPGCWGATCVGVQVASAISCY